MNRMRRRLTALVAAFTAGATGTVLAITVVTPTPAQAAGETLVATIVETSDIHAEGYPAANLENMNATARVAAAQNPDGILLAGDSTLDGLASEFQAFNESDWGTLKPKILAAPGNHDWHQAPPTPFMNYFGYSRTYNSRDVAGVHLITLDADTNSGSPSLNVGGEQYNWLHADLDAHAGMPIFAAWHYPRYSVGDVHGDQDSTEIRNAWSLLQEHGAEMVFSGHDHLYQRFPRANADGTLNPAAGLREIVGATGGSGYLYGIDPSASVLTPDYAQNTTEGIVRISIYTDHLEWAHVGVDGVVRDSGSDTLNHPVGPGTNRAPVVDAGPDVGVTLPDGASLAGSVSDDGLPAGSSVAVSWAMASGPGTVAFADAAAASTTATFSAAGSYQLRLTATDGELTSSDTTTVTVSPGGGGGTTTTVQARMAAGSDDAEEGSGGSVDLASSDLELVTEGSTVQTVGVRFPGLAVPRGAQVTAASIQFQVDEVSTDTASLTVRGQAADNAATFSTATGNVSGRARTTAATTWVPPAWSTVGARGIEQRTPDLSAVVQEVVNRSGWASGNAMAFVVTGSGRRTAEAFESGAASAAVLSVSYVTGGGGGPTNAAPVVDAGPDRSVTLPDAVSLAGSVSDDGLPAGSSVSVLWDTVSGPGTVAFADAAAASTTATFSAAGSYQLRLTASDGELTSSDTTTVTVSPASGGGGTTTTVEAQVSAGRDDAEQRASGGVSLNSTDLELVTDGHSVQTVGLRFGALAVPNGAAVEKAWIQFSTDEVTTAATSLRVAAQAADNAATFTNSTGNVSSRPRTTAVVGWMPTAWSVRGERGAAQRTPDLSTVLQEVVSRSGWRSGNAAVFIVTGTGKRTAVAFEKSATAAPLLHVEYRLP